MRVRRGAALGLGGVLGALALAQGLGAPPSDDAGPATQAKARAAYAKLPLRFEPNRGQSDRDVRFISRGAGYTLFLTAREAVLSLGSRARGGATTSVRIRPLGGSPRARLSAGERQPGHSNYLIGDDPRKWRTGVPGYGQVSYRDVYPGIDLVYRGNQRRLEYDFVLAPGADPRRIVLAMGGARRLSIAPDGDLVLHTAAGRVRQERPFAYQRVARGKKEVRSGYELMGKGRVGFSLGAYDRSRPLVIDPVLAYSTYLGGNSGFSTELGRGIAADPAGSAYVTGGTPSNDFPGTGGRPDDPLQGPRADDDAFVTKLNPSGTDLAYSTYLGGTQLEEGSGIAVHDGNAYVTGKTASADYPTTRTTALRPAKAPSAVDGLDGFVTKLDDQGALDPGGYSTYLGGSGNDEAHGVAVDSAGNAYVTGYTESRDLLTKSGEPPGQRGPFQATLSQCPHGPVHCPDAFAVKLNPAKERADSLVYSTYLGGSRQDEGLGIAVDAVGNAYLTGETHSKAATPSSPADVAFPTRHPFQSGLDGDTDAFVTKLNPSGTDLAYSTYLGGTSGSGGEHGRAIAVDSAGHAYVAGTTPSGDFDLAGNPLQKKINGDGDAGAGDDAFVSKLDPGVAGPDSLVYSTYLGGANDEDGYGIAVDSTGNAHVVGTTDSRDFPKEKQVDEITGTCSGAHFPPCPDAFVTKLNALGSSLLYSTYLGGDTDEQGYGIALDRSASAHVTGQKADPVTPSTPLTADLQDAFVAKISPVVDLSITKTGSPDPARVDQLLNYTVRVANAGQDTASGVTVEDPLPQGVDFASASSRCTEAARVVTCTLDDVTAGAAPVERQITVTPRAANTALSNIATVRSAMEDSNPGNDSARADTRVLAPQADLSITKTGSPETVRVDEPLTYTISVENAGQDNAKAVTVEDALPEGVDFASASSGCTEAARVVTCSLGDLAGGSAPVERKITVTPRAANPTLSNTATVRSPTDDPNPGNNSARADTTVLPADAVLADLSITKTDSPDPVRVDQPLTYTIGVRNAGPSTAAAVSVRDELPDGVDFGSASSGCSEAARVVTCTLGDVTAGAAPVERQIAVTPRAANPTLTNSASVQSPTDDPVSDNDRASATTEVLPAPANLSITKTDSPDPVEAGQPLTYTLRATNGGPGAAGAVSLTDRLPSGVTFVGASAGCSQALGTVTCDLGQLASGASAERTIVVRPTLPGAELSNTASVQSASSDDDQSDNSATATTVVRQPTGAPPGGGGAQPGGGGRQPGGGGTQPGGGGDDRSSGVDPRAGSRPCANRLAVRRRSRRAGRRGATRLTGTALGDALLGSPGRDVLRGLAGDDCLTGKAGNDTLAGGPGDDSLRGGTGKDKLSGGPGTDKLSGGPGADRINAADGVRETVGCGSGSDRVRADRSDRLRGCERRSFRGR